MSEIKKYIEVIASGGHLPLVDAGRVFQIIMAGGATPAQIAAVITGMRVNHENIDEITGAVMAIRNKAQRIKLADALKGKIIDTCGTGGDAKGTYNISTAVAIVTAAAGVPVAKHGNRAVSSRTGSADVLSALGVNIDATSERAVECLEQAGLCFMMAPKYHSALKHVAPVRLELGIRTIFNIIGPLVNPAEPKMHLLGVFSPDLVEPLAHVLKNLESESAWVVHGSDGMDEITLFGETIVAELKDGEVKKFTINPTEFGFAEYKPEDLSGGDAQENATALHNLLKGAEGAYRDIVVLNSGAALVVARKAKDLSEGINLAREAIDSGKARQTLHKLVELTNS